MEELLKICPDSRFFWLKHRFGQGYLLKGYIEYEQEFYFKIHDMIAICFKLNLN
jgi:hypothetical protein